jgi:uncharacterized membrane protein YbhN (UPF0104 family)
MSRQTLIPERSPEVLLGQAGVPPAARVPARGWVIAALLTAALCGAVVAAHLADLDLAGDLWDRAGTISGGAARVNWGLVPVVAALTALHYLASALGVRAAVDGVAGRRLGLREITAVQFAGAAANRLAPGGLGSAAVTCRYLTRRGLPSCEATATVAAVSLVRGLTKLALVALAIVVWGHGGLGNAVLPSVHAGRLMRRHPALLVPAAIVTAGTAVALVLAVLYRRRRQARVRVRAAITGVLRALRHMLLRPRCLLASLAAAAGANLALALAFAVSVIAVPGAGKAPFGALLAVYLLGATAGAAVPTPAGVGSTEAALITALAAVHVSAAQAAQGVLLFRIMTFWAPVPVGVVSTRRLRRHGGL